MTTPSPSMTPAVYPLDELIRWLEAEFELVSDPPHGGTWRNLFYKEVNRHPATTTRVLKILTDNRGMANSLQLCAESDNNHCVLMDIPDALSHLAPYIQREIRSVIDRVQRSR